MREDDDVIAFLGPDEGCTSEALVAAAWNMPMISYVNFMSFEMEINKIRNRNHMILSSLISHWLISSSNSQKCTDTAVSNKSVFHSFARTLAPASKASHLNLPNILPTFHYEHNLNFYRFPKVL